MENNKEKIKIEKQFQEMVDKAKEIYPDISESLVTMNNIISHTEDISNYLNLTIQTPSEISNNQISIT